MSACSRLNLMAPAGSPASCAQDQTRETFGFKWARRDSYESPAVQEAGRVWLLERYCEGDSERLGRWLAEGGGRKLILDAGCGSGHSALLLFGDHLRQHDYLGVDISSACEVGRTRFAERAMPGDFLQCDLMDLPVPDGSFDVIFSEGVLHHTDDPRAAFHALVRKLAPGGRFLFYVYARKAVIREFTDDLIRDRIQGLSDPEAWAALEPLTRLGKALGDLKATIEVPEDVPLLGIRKGQYDLQRFFYWHVCKSFYREDWTLEEMNHVNFDWFRPMNCHRQTPEEVRGWVASAGLELERFQVEDAGISVVAVRP